MATYWFDVFTSKTWAELRAHAFAVTGFSQSKYSTVKHVQPGDIFFICYLKGAKTLIGALRAAGEPYQSAEPPIWGEGGFPARVPVEPLIILDTDHAVDFTQVLPALSFYNPANMMKTWAVLQGSPTRLKGIDGEAMMQSLHNASDAQRTGLPVVPLPATADRPTSEEPLKAAVTEPTSAPVPLSLVDPLQALLDELTAAQRDVAHPARLERAVAEAFRFLGFDVALLGQAGRTDLTINAPLGHERFRAVIDAKASSSGKIPDGQINWPAIDAHRKQEGADYAAVVGERFAGGNLQTFAGNFSIALLDTDSLAEVLRLHAATPFPASDLRPLVASAGPVVGVVADLRQKSQATERHWRLIADVVTIVDGFSRLDEPPVPSAGNLHAVLVARALGASRSSSSPPSELDVRDALSFLASRAVGVLRPVEPDTAGYRLTMTLPAALQRLRAVQQSIQTALGNDQGSTESGVVAFGRFSPS